VQGPGDAAVHGRFDVEARTEEMLPARWSPDTTEGSGAARAASETAPGSPRPLHTLPWPYLAILVLLCAEWVGRRRVGLR